MQTLRAWLVTAAVTIMTGMTTMMLIVVGSGIRPIALEVLLLFAAALGLILSSVELFPSARRLRPIVRRFLAAIIVAISTARVFHAVQRVAFERAKRHGAAVARAVETARTASGRWPRSLRELPMSSLPAPPRSPFLSHCDGHYCDVVAGYSVFYAATGTGEPRFVVGNPERGVLWEWRAKTWSPLDRNR